MILLGNHGVRLCWCCTGAPVCGESQ